MEYLPIILTSLFGVIFTIIGYLLSKKDTQQEEFIKDLYIKHEADAAKLALLELLVASDHYRKGEIDNLFSMMRTTLNEGFERVEKAIHEIRMNNK